MNVTGVMLRDWIKAAETHRVELEKSFVNASVRNAAGSKLRSMMEQIETINAAINHFQKVYAEYNLAIVFKFEGKLITLFEAFYLTKLLARQETLWGSIPRHMQTPDTREEVRETTYRIKNLREEVTTATSLEHSMDVEARFIVYTEPLRKEPALSTP